MPIRQTGLIWKQCAEGLSGAGCATGSVAYYNWGGALGLATQSTYAGYKDWRLPNAKELESLVEEQCIEPAVNLAVFPNTLADWHWSSSPAAYNVGGAWLVFFGNGYSSNGYRGLSFAVRLVRGG